MNETQKTNTYDVVVIGGGQAGLSLGFYQRRSGLGSVILDGQTKAGGFTAGILSKCFSGWSFTEIGRGLLQLLDRCRCVQRRRLPGKKRMF